MQEEMIPGSSPFPKDRPFPSLRIQQDILNKLGQDDRIDPNLVRIQVSGGTVAIDGFVEDEAARLRAADLAREVPGVNTVLNHLTVRRAG